jgi:hypothetical protein
MTAQNNTHNSDYNAIETAHNRRTLDETGGFQTCALLLPRLGGVEVIEKLGITEEEAKKIWEVWAGEWHHKNGEFDQVWLTYSALEESTGVDIKRLKKFIKLFRDKGLAVHNPCINSDYEPSGSGIFLIKGFSDYTWQEIKETLC